MSQVIDPNSADSEINDVTRVSASPAVTPSRHGFPLRRGSQEGVMRNPYFSEYVFLEFKASLILEVPHSC